MKSNKHKETQNKENNQTVKTRVKKQHKSQVGKNSQHTNGLKNLEK